MYHQFTWFCKFKWCLSLKLYTNLWHYHTDQYKNVYVLKYYYVKYNFKKLNTLVYTKMDSQLNEIVKATNTWYIKEEECSKETL
jgi:hypothetical protein